MSVEMNSHKPNLKRRNILRGIIGLFGFLWGGLALYPIYRYLRSGEKTSATSNVTSVTVGTTASLPVAQGKNFQFGSIPGIIVHTQDGFHAYNAICTHLGCTVQFRSDTQKIWCACHGGTYDPTTGKVLAGPPPRPLTPLRVAIKNGNIIVSES